MTLKKQRIKISCFIILFRTTCINKMKSDVNLQIMIELNKKVPNKNSGRDSN